MGRDLALRMIVRAGENAKVEEAARVPTYREELQPEAARCTALEKRPMTAISIHSKQEEKLGPRNATQAAWSHPGLYTVGVR